MNGSLMPEKHWSIAGAGGEAIFVSTDCAAAGLDIRGAVLFAHGFKGYKDYGFIPLLGRRLAGALPVVVHRFNFSHSGMTNDLDTFARPDLFERDTWNAQVADLVAMSRAVSAGEAPQTPASAPIAFLGHSRGGVTSLLTAGRMARDGIGPAPAAIVTVAAPAATLNLSPEARRTIREEGRLRSPSSRTGQSLAIGRAWIDEQDENPEDHDLLALCRSIRCSVLAIHGEADPAVPPASAERIAGACSDGKFILIPNANHVFNTPNPADPEAPFSPELEQLAEHVIAFLSASGFGLA